jgi:uncharacterized protein YbbC (DUF1343 family)
MRSRAFLHLAVLLISGFFVMCQGAAQRPRAATADVPPPIRPGAWQMDRYLPMLEGRAVAMVVNQTSIVGRTHLIDTLLSRGVRVVKVFAPEHGLRGQADAGEHVKDGLDARTGIPVVSLYGDKKKPAASDLAGIDVIVFDMQDVGARFYTYISTLHLIMEAGAENNIPVIVLDRPNPNGHYIDGPVLDTAYRSFIGMHPIPVVYGLTMGELARMINGERWIPRTCDLTVIPCTGYDHTRSYDLPVKPSPNLPNLRSVLLYPGLCFFEGTAFSVGRGTDRQFQVVGHPDYPDRAFAFTPEPMPGAMQPPWKGKACYGLDLSAASVDSLFANRRMDLSVLLKAYHMMPVETFFKASSFDRLAGGPAFRRQLEAGLSEAQIREAWRPGLAAFNALRKKYLLYPDFRQSY